MPIKYDLLIFIGRFQPFHRGHKRVVQLAMEQAHHVLLLVGSSFRPRDIKNPFTFDERREMIQNSLDPTEISRTTIRPLRDYLYNDNRWMQEVQRHVETLLSNIHPSVDGYRDIKDMKIGIIGHDKDESSWYLKAFPQWDFVPVGKKYIETIDATTIRQLWLSQQSAGYTSGALSASVHDFIYNKFPKKEYERLVREYDHLTKYWDQWKVAPYPVIFQTVDAVLIQSGHILMVHRKDSPGEGLLALPGGFVNYNETLEDSLIRELREETRIKVPDPVLRGNIKAKHTFDAPGRSLRGRTITTAYLIELPPGPIPKVKGGDDAAKADWYLLADIEKRGDEIFEDHTDIINFYM
jgi:bifunctional NMN adenylyltransferase/nudix hydrolase